MRGTNGESEEEDVFFGSYSADRNSVEPGSRVCSGRKYADSAAGNQPAGSTDGIIGGGQYKMAVSGRQEFCIVQLRQMRSMRR